MESTYQGKGNKQPDIPIEILFDYFKDLNAASTDYNEVDLLPLDEDQINQLNYDLNLHVEKEEIFKFIQKLKNNKTNGGEDTVNLMNIFKPFQITYRYV